MALFRKKQVVVEAMQYDGKNASAIQGWAGLESITEDFGGGIEFTTNEVLQRVEVGSWVVRGVNGSLYACTNENLMAAYDAVGDCA